MEGDVANKVLVVVPYGNLYPPINGGMQRCFHVLHQLSKHFKVTALILQDKNEFLRAAKEYPSISTISVHSTVNVPEPVDLFRFFPLRIKTALRHRWYKKSFAGPSNSGFVSIYPVLKRVVQQDRFELVVLENIATLAFTKLIRRYQPQAKIIFDAHNVDSELAYEQLNKGVISHDAYEDIRKQESDIANRADGVFACSSTDLEKLNELNGRNLNGSVIPNGARLYDKLFDEEVMKDSPSGIIFCGSLDYAPNAEGLFWFWKKIWPAVIKEKKELKLCVVGSGKLPVQYDLMYQDPSFVFTGRVEDVKPYYNKAAVAIVPLQSGSGTRLKILEAMGLGIPVISTSKGAEGIELTNAREIVIEDDENSFGSSLLSLLADKQRRLRLRNDALQLMRAEYDWDVIGKKLTNFLEKIEGGTPKQKNLSL